MRTFSASLTAGAACVAILGSAWMYRRAQPIRTAAAHAPSSDSAVDLLSLANTLAAAPRNDALDRDFARVLRALRSNEKDSDAWVRLGDNLSRRSRGNLDTTLYPQIEKIYLRAHTLDATNGDALAGLAWIAGACHRFGDSIAWATLALQIEAELPAAHGIIGDAAVELGDFDKAAVHYQRMLDLKPDLGSYSRGAHLLYLRGKAQAAMALMRRAIAAGAPHSDETAWCVADLALMLCREGAAGPALTLVENELRHLPRNIALLNAAGHARMSLNDDSGAIAAYEQSLSLAPQHASLAALHDLYLSSGRPEAAALAAKELIGLHERLKGTVLGGEGLLARFYADRGDNLTEAIRLAEYEHAHHGGAASADTLAWVYHRAGRNQDAAKLIPAILRSRVPDPAMLYHVAMIEEALGLACDAQRHLCAAVARQPRFNPVHAPRVYATLEKIGSRSHASTLVPRKSERLGQPAVFSEISP